jgi:hypothetical protein
MCKMMKQHPDMLDMLKIYCDKWKKKKTNFKSWRKTDPFTTSYVRIWNLVNDVQLSCN